MSNRRAIARFHPQAWVNDYAIDADPEGETTWDITDAIVAMGREASLALRDDDYASDYLRESTEAPAWIKEWSGPFYIEAEESIREYWKET